MLYAIILYFCCHFCPYKTMYEPNTKAPVDVRVGV